MICRKGMILIFACGQGLRENNRYADTHLETAGTGTFFFRQCLVSHKRFGYYFYGTIFRREPQIVPKNSLRDRKEFLCERY
jgi:hypothetical protein